MCPATAGCHVIPGGPADAVHQLIPDVHSALTSRCSRSGSHAQIAQPLSTMLTAVVCTGVTALPSRPNTPQRCSTLWYEVQKSFACALREPSSSQLNIQPCFDSNTQTSM
eukprot:GHUV01037326.1.p2 GENE.GHUV01037326.1~~GHUV01037326.1.p2  ORF type:complete len:110 (-),score=0.73 GHUV01037326.1:148-477(-)